MSSSFLKPQAQQFCSYEHLGSLPWKEMAVKIICKLFSILTAQQVYCWRDMESLGKVAKEKWMLHKVPWALKNALFQCQPFPVWSFDGCTLRQASPSESAFLARIPHGSLASSTQKNPWKAKVLSHTVWKPSIWDQGLSTTAWNQPFIEQKSLIWSLSDDYYL